MTMPKYLRIMMLASALTAGSMCAVRADRPEQGIEQPASQQTSVSPGVHCIEIVSTSSEPLTVEIYALTGQMVEQATVADGTIRIDIKPGYYIVRIGRHSSRVVVR